MCSPELTSTSPLLPVNWRFPFLLVSFVRPVQQCWLLPWFLALPFVLPALTSPFAVPCPASLPQLFPSTAKTASIATPSLGGWLLAGAAAGEEHVAVGQLACVESFPLLLAGLPGPPLCSPGPFPSSSHHRHTAYSTGASWPPAAPQPMGLSSCSMPFAMVNGPRTSAGFRVIS